MKAWQLFQRLRPRARVLEPEALFRCGTITTAETVIFQGCGDFSVGYWMKETHHSPPQFRARYVAFEGCDKNFVASWLHRSVLPETKLIFLNSHPCGPVFRNIHDFRSPGASGLVYLADRWMYQAERYAPGLIGTSVHSLENDDVPCHLLPDRIFFFHHKQRLTTA